MALDIDIATQPVPEAAQAVGEIKAIMANVRGTLIGWRATITTTSEINSGEAQSNYQMIVGAKLKLNALKVTPGLNEYWRARKPGLPVDYDAVAEIGGVETALESFASWFRTNWPKKTATGEPAYVAFSPTGEHVSFPFPLNAGAKTAVLNRINGVLDALF